MSFMWKRNDMFYLSETGEVWEHGIVYWDACSSQVCSLDANGSRECNVIQGDGCAEVLL